MNALKSCLLKTAHFIDNEYLDQYCSLISQNKDQRKIKYQTQKHHILPRCYFKLINLEIDNSKENLVNLLYKDHILAHYYLCLCTEGKLHYRLANAFFHLIHRKWKYEDFSPETDLSEYQKIHEMWRKEMSQDKSRSERCTNLFKGCKWDDSHKINYIKSISKRVQNLETGEVFLSSTFADISCSGKHTYSVQFSCVDFDKNINHLAYGYHWCYLKKEQSPYTEEERKELLKALPPRKLINAKRVQNLETGEVYDRYQDAGLKYLNEISGAVTLITNSVRNTSNKIGKPVKGNHYIKLNSDNIVGYTKEERIEILESFNYQNLFVILCVEDNIIFESYNKIAKYYNLTPYEVICNFQGIEKIIMGKTFKKLTPQEIKEYFVSKVI